MNEAIKVAISSDFLSSFASLPRQVQKKVTEFINKFKTNSKSSGINLEKIKDGTDKNMCSVRIDNTYRGILVRQEGSNVYLLLWVDHHDEAYEWARRKRCEINKRTGSIQIFDVKETIMTDTVSVTNGIFDNIKNEDLLSLGVPESLFNYLRTLKTPELFYKYSDSFPKDVVEPLSWIAEGTDISEVIEAYAENKPETVPANLEDALKTPINMQSFVVVEGEDELKKIMSAPLEKWRIFLHPTQRKIVNKNYSGSARVLGGAGTGKTVVAMHRAKFLASRLGNNEKLLFTTFTANLASDIRENLSKICTIDEIRKIEVINLDAWVTQFLREQGYKYRIIYGEEISELLEKAVLISDNELDFPVSFYEEEWLKVVTAQEAFSIESYIKAGRTGRGTRLDRKKRMQVWIVFENFIKLMKQEQVRDINYAMYECQLILSSSLYNTCYRHIIVDEGQDFSSSAYSLLRKIAGPEHDNDIFIVGDAHQRIYRNTATLSKSGINIKGRSRKLKINYRTTDEIHKYAFALLKGISFDNLDGESDDIDQCKSLTHGQAPIVSSFKDIGQEINFIISEIDKLIENGAVLADICVIARTHRLLDTYINEFTRSGIRCYEIKNSNTDKRTLDGLRLATMHRVKGLEFKYVFIASVIEDVIPLKSAINHTDSVTEQDTVTSEKCLLYVSLTRAQKQAYITGYGKMSEFVVG
ncbi:MAG: AAA family ATPase [Oscillospiraceae bacterium]|nr:AAA family ATPase [Oscillospiraceae bacterium]